MRGRFARRGGAFNPLRRMPRLRAAAAPRESVGMLAEQASAARLAPAEIDAYRRDGLVVPDYRLPPDQLSHLQGALDELIAANPEIRPEQLISAHVAKGGGERVRGHRAFLDFAHDPA